MSYYDLVIVGAGPAGLALAHCSSMLNKKILVIDKEHTIGGCHRVKRVHNGMFTEHGPRIYLSIYLNFFYLLSEIGIKQDDIFTNYNYNFISVFIKIIMPQLSSHEIFVFVKAYMYYLVNTDYGNNISVLEYLEKNKFSAKSIYIIDKLCKINDGAGAEMYSLNKLIKITDAIFTVNILQPKKPLDIILFDKWQSFLQDNGVHFSLGHNITYLHHNQNTKKIEYIIVNNKKIFCDKIVLAFPPENIVGFIDKFDIKDAFGSFEEFDEWTEKTEYLEYINITYHFKDKLDLPKIYGVNYEEWCVGLINLSDYMTDIENGYKTVLSATLLAPEQKNLNSGKTANDCDKDELIEETFRQIKKYIFKNIPENYVGILNPNNYYDYKNRVWENKDGAFFNTVGTKHIDFQSHMISNLYNLGTQNGQSHINYTTIESAVSNAMSLSTQFFPELKERYYLRKFIVMRDIIFFIIIVLLILYLVYLIQLLTC
jgi:hypothetical protein